MNEIYKLNDDDMCCPQEPEKCPADNSCNTWKKQYEEYLAVEECKPEEEFKFNICDYDPSEIYFMQYRSKHAFYNEWWMHKKIFDKSFDKTFE